MYTIYESKKRENGPIKATADPIMPPICNSDFLVNETPEPKRQENMNDRSITTD